MGEFIKYTLANKHNTLCDDFKKVLIASVKVFHISCVGSLNFIGKPVSLAFNVCGHKVNRFERTLWCRKRAMCGKRGSILRLCVAPKES